MAAWNSWVPGVLSQVQLAELYKTGFISGGDMRSIDASAVDLHLSDEAYRLIRGSAKPFGENYLATILKEGLAERIELNSDNCFELLPRITYLFRLKERIEGSDGISLYGQATAKSSVGRLDVLARLIVDGMDHYEAFVPKAIAASGAAMYLEVTPITFPALARPGDSLNQLRLFYGRPEDCEITGIEIFRTCFAGEGKDHHLRVDLTHTPIFGVEGCGFRAMTPSKTMEPIPLWERPKAEKPDPSKWWEIVPRDRHGLLRIAKNHFYILRSKERLSLPPQVAVYARAIDEEIGEMRIHYAGFAHPHFGWQRDDKESGTPLIFEVRGHDVDVSLRDGEILARLRFFRMSQDSPRPEKKPKQPQEKSAADTSSYDKQELKLSKYFADWSSPPTLADTEAGAV
jgi:dCTP deaminase